MKKNINILKKKNTMTFDKEEVRMSRVNNILFSSSYLAASNMRMSVFGSVNTNLHEN
jgi:hypothetical protein